MEWLNNANNRGGNDNARMTICPARVRRFAGMCLALVALVLTLTTTASPGQAARRTPHANRVNDANVLIEPYVSKTLWFFSLDPAQAGGPPDNDAIVKIYAGLVKQVYDDATGRFTIAPDLAARMPTVSTDGLVYTFRLRPDARFSDGTPVTAQDVVYSLNRALVPAEKSPIASFYLTDILGSAAVAAGKARSCRGLQAIGTETVRITLDKPVSYFLSALSYPTSFVLKHTVPAGAPLTTAPALVVGAGPFMVKGGMWQYRHQLTLVPNPYYYNARHIKLKEIDLVFTGTEETAFAAYRAGQFPMAPLPAAEAARYRGTPDFHESASLWDSFIVMNVKIPPFTNRHFRRAVAFAINRKAIVNGVFRGNARLLYGWYPRGLMGYDPTLYSQVPHYDPVIARRELAQARAELRHIPANIPMTVNGEMGDWVRMYEQVQSDLKAIGISISLHPVSGAGYASVVPKGKTPLYGLGWLADYPDPQDWSDGLLETGGGWNWNNYSNPTLDRLFTQADIERDPATRERLYKQAQLLLLNDAPVAMTHQIATQAVISTHIHGIELNPIWGYWPQPMHNDWANVTVSP